MARVLWRDFSGFWLFTAIGLANELNAQSITSAGLTGVITDQSKAVVPGTIVELPHTVLGHL